MMKTNSNTNPEHYIGLDVHQEPTSVAIADPGSDGAPPPRISRIRRIQGHMEQLCTTWSRQPIVAAIMSLRGFRIIASMIGVSEIGDFIRFTHPKPIMSYLGLTPDECSSGGKETPMSQKISMLSEARRFSGPVRRIPLRRC